MWGTIEVDALSEHEARQKVMDGEYDYEFEPNGKTGNEGVYSAELVGDEAQ
jgi:hypothetical protein